MTSAVKYSNLSRLIKPKICATTSKHRSVTRYCQCSGRKRKQSHYRCQKSWFDIFGLNIQKEKCFFVFLLMLFSICEAEQRDAGSYGDRRWWRKNVELLTAVSGFIMGEDPLLMSGYYEGDVLPTPSDDSRTGVAMEKNAVVSPSMLWSDGIVPFEFSPGYNILPFEKFLITRSMSDIESRSCIRFVPHTDEYDYIRIIFDSYKCYSNIGRVGGEQVLSLGFFCVMFFDKGNVYHELFHALGFHHEHTRPDRDEFVDVMWKNIKQEARKNFHKRDYGSVDMLSLPYDIDSVMHYSPHAFSKMYYVLPTLVSHQRGIFFTRSRWPSKIDYAKLNTLYHCEKRRLSSMSPPRQVSHRRRQPSLNGILRD